MSVDYTFPNRPVGGRRAPALTNGPMLRLEDFVATGIVPQRPASTDDTKAITFALDDNDSVGDCVPTGFDNFRRIITKLLTGTEVDTSLAQVIAWYVTQNPGFDINGTADTNGPGSSHDNGMDMQVFLALLVKTGVIVGFASFDPKNDALVQTALWLFEAVYLGGTLQVAQQSQSDQGYWDYAPNSGTWGGHCFVGAAYDAAGNMQMVTWKELIRATVAWRAHCLDEAFVVILKEHVNNPSFRAGFDLPKFAAAFTAITGRPFPVAVGPSPTPTPVPPAPVVPPFLVPLVTAVQNLANHPDATGWLSKHHTLEPSDVAPLVQAILSAPRA